ncbi:hypothetical protein KP509_04G039100 [Ceratopteris richardii]|uniref:Pentatricopeptide repeat-containing protein n=1 Tax=Ceratopteris richardii TaxID=49495 RepID=A0A8T2UW99_CERRI|nr:hypothetical protein KP509_04G039100 [Ceratopteris richardii]
MISAPCRSFMQNKGSLYSSTLSAISTAYIALDAAESFREIVRPSSSVFTHTESNGTHFCTFKDIQEGFDALAQPDRSQLVEGIRKCNSIYHVRRCHHHCLVTQIEQDTYLANSLVFTYAKYGALYDSKAVFKLIIDRSVVTWTALISALVRHEAYLDALLLYRQMHQEGTTPNNVTFIALLGACMNREFLTEGKRLHACISKEQLSDVILGTSIITMYGRCRSLEDARALFSQLPNANIVTWNAIMTIYVELEQGKEAIFLIQRMHSAGLEPNDCTYINGLKACALLEDITLGRAIHVCVVAEGLISDIVVSNSLVNMYGKCGALDDALYIFSGMPKHDVITWNGIISSYVQQGYGAEGLELFRNMQQQGIKPERVTFINVVGACANITALDEGKWIHACLLNDALESDSQVGNALIHMYGQCGALKLARIVFYKVRPHNVVSWTAITSAFAQQGRAKEALHLFQEMQENHVKPDDVAYISVLSACSHAGLVEEGIWCFLSMWEYGLNPNIEHYVCMIDLFGRAGLLSEAEEFMCKMPRWHDGRLWAALLSSCTIHSDIYRGKNAAEQMITFGAGETASYVLLANLYAANVKRDSESPALVLSKMMSLSDEEGDSESMRILLDRMVAAYMGSYD